MSDGWKPREYDPAICAQIRADIEAQPRKTIGERIEQAIAEGNEWRVMRLQTMAQQQFNLMVQSNGEIASTFADIREQFQQYTQYEDYKPFDTKAELEKRFDVTTDPETGQYLIHPKGMNSIVPAEMPEGWKPWGR